MTGDLSVNQLNSFHLNLIHDNFYIYIGQLMENNLFHIIGKSYYSQKKNYIPKVLEIYLLWYYDSEKHLSILLLWNNGEINGND